MESLERKDTISDVVAVSEQPRVVSTMKLYNRMEDNFQLSNKKALFLNMKNYYEAINQDVFNALPVTFHIKEVDDPEFERLKAYYFRKSDDSEEAR